MFRLLTNARTSWVGELNVENKPGVGDQKPYEAKTILFKVASNRDYAVTKVVNGQQVKEKPADFLFCRAHGSIAQAINDYCKEKKVGEEGKFVSRHLELAGHLETYMTQKTVPVEQVVNIGGVDYKITLNAKVDVEQTVFVVKELNFLDSSNKPKVAEVKTIEGVTITPVNNTGAMAQSNFPNTQSTVSATGGVNIPNAGCATAQVQDSTQTSSTSIAPNIPLTGANELTFIPDASSGNCPF